MNRQQRLCCHCTRGISRAGDGGLVSGGGFPPHNVAGVLLVADLVGIFKVYRDKERNKFRFLHSVVHLCCCSFAVGDEVAHRGISSRCSASVLHSHQGKIHHQRTDPCRLAASAGRLLRKSCCSCSKKSRRARVHQLKPDSI